MNPRPLARLIVTLAILATPTFGLSQEAASQATIRIATYNASLFGKTEGEILERLSDGKDEQAEKVAAIVQTVRPDVLLINELDYEEDDAAARLLAQKFFAKPQDLLEAIDYPYVFVAASNTGVASGMDLNKNNRTGEPNDCWGYGVYPGQYSFAIFSKFPIDDENIRTFQQFLWKDLPRASRPVDPESGESYYDDETWNSLRLSSKNHVDVPVVVGGERIHVLASHPTPPVFDGPEDRNGCRNHDEINFWNFYLAGASSKTLVDDQGKRGGLEVGSPFVIMGDLNSDPLDGDSRQTAIRKLLAHRFVTDPKASSEGAVSTAKKRDLKGEPQFDTAEFGRGHFRVDYVLPSRNLELVDAEVFWPPEESEEHGLIKASDHRMVWIEVKSP